MDLESLRNRIVDFFHREKIWTGFVLDVKGKRVHLFLPSGKEELVSHLAILFPGKQRHSYRDLAELQLLLKEKNERREKLKELFDLRELWEILVEDLEESDPWTLVSLYLGREPEEDEVSAFVRLITEDRLYFYVVGTNQVKFRTKEEVEKILHQREKERERVRFLTEAERVLKALLSEKSEEISPADLESWKEIFKDYLLREDTTERGKVLKELLQKHNLAEPLKLFDLLSSRGLIQEEWFLELEKTGFPENFSQEELEEAEKILSLSIVPDDRELLTHLDAFTIDAEETEDFDDALSVLFLDGRTELWIHIAEVSQYVSPESHLWKGALERASTLYLPERILPMFPFSLSHEKFSLRKGEEKLALSFRFLISSSGEIEKFQIVPSIIEIKKRYTYDQVDMFLREGDQFWTSLYNLLMQFKRKRQEAGAFAVILPEISVRVKEDGTIEVKKIEMTPARDLIAEAMIVTNFYTALYLSENQIPAIYRSQKEPFQIIEGREGSPFHQLLQLRFMAKSELSLEPAFHSGLGLSHYTTVTSPIRRFPDLLIQYQLEASLIKKRPLLSREELTRMLPEIQANLQRAQYLQNRRKRYFLLKYLKQNQDHLRLRGIILEIQTFKVKVYLPDFNLTGELSGVKGNFHLGQEVEVMLDKVNPLLEILRLRLI